MVHLQKRLWLTLLAFTSLLLVSAWGVGMIIRWAEPEEPKRQQAMPSIGDPAAAGYASVDSPAGFDAMAETRLDCSSRDLRIGPTTGSEALVYGPWDNGGWTDFHSQAGGGGQRLGQALLGDEVEVLVQEAGWSQVRFRQTSGPLVWIDSTHLTTGSERVRMAWESSRILFVAAAPGVQVTEGPFLPFGSRLPIVIGAAGDPGRLLLPDGCAVDFSQPLNRTFSSALAISEALEQAKKFRRVPYEAGANTRWAMDASGLVFLVFRVTGGSVPRSLEQQFRVGLEVPLKAARQGDVLFLSTFEPKRPQPVILLDDGETYLAASPSIGVSVGLMSQMRNRKVLSVRRYV